jgi:hypothetical protein
MLEILYKIFDFVVILVVGYCMALFAGLLFATDTFLEYIYIEVSILLGLVVLLGILSSIGLYMMKKRF